MIKKRFSKTEWRNWKSMIEIHRRKIDSASSVIDRKNSSVSRLRLKLVNRKSINTLRSARDVEKDNKRLMDKLIRIARLPVIIRPENPENKLSRMKYLVKKRENMKLFKDNVRIADRLYKTASVISFKKFEADYTQKERLRRIIRRPNEN